MVDGGPGRREDRADGLTLVVLGGGPAQRHAIDAAAALGARTVVCDVNPERGDVAVSSEDVDGVLRVARDEAARGLIAPGTDWPVRVAAEVAEELDLPHPLDLATAQIATSKLAQRERLAAAGVPQPAWSVDGPPSFPVVVKAADRQGQRAMSIVGHGDELAAAVERARRAARSGVVLFEEFAPGPEVTVNGFAVDGRHHVAAVTARDHFDGAPGVAQRHVYPSGLDDETAARVAGESVAALGIRQGPTYTQIVLSPDGPRVMEVAARLGGGHDSELVRRTTGVDLATAAVRAALGLPVDPAALQPLPAAAGVIEFLQAPAGTLAGVSGPPEATFYHPPGHVYGPLRVATDRAGYVIWTALTRQEALAEARTAAEAVRFEVT
jgi:biotin carboxylase